MKTSHLNSVGTQKLCMLQLRDARPRRQSSPLPHPRDQGAQESRRQAQSPAAQDPDGQEHVAVKAQLRLRPSDCPSDVAGTPVTAVWPQTVSCGEDGPPSLGLCSLLTPCSAGSTGSWLSLLLFILAPFL